MEPRRAWRPDDSGIDFPAPLLGEAVAGPSAAACR
jgi:hypothetical protein